MLNACISKDKNGEGTSIIVIINVTSLTDEIISEDRMARKQIHNHGTFNHIFSDETCKIEWFSSDQLEKIEKCSF